MWKDPKDEEETPETPNASPQDAPKSTGSPETDALDIVAPEGVKRRNNHRERFLKDTPAKIEAAYAGKLAAGEITEEQIAKIVWLVQVGKANGDNRRTLAEKIGVSDTTISRLFSGDYEARLDKVIERIEDFQRQYHQRVAVAKGHFIETSLAKKIWQVCDAARAYSALIPIYGDPQTGKTEALIEYAKLNNHGTTFYMRMPTGGGKTVFLRELSRVLGENAGANIASLAKVPFNRLTSRNLLIIDEFTQAFIVAGNGGIRLHTIEFIREIHDRTGCAVILCGTNGVQEQIERGRHKGVLEQLRRRAMATLQLPPILPRSDMDLLAAAYGLSPADDAHHELRLSIIKTTGLRAYTNFLKAASAMASKRGISIGWSHFTSAHDILAKLSNRASK